MNRIAVLLTVGVAVAAVLPAQSIKTTGNIETDGQLQSNVATGTPPLAVTSTTTVPNLDADTVDGFEGTELDTRLTNAETLLLAVQDEVTSQLQAKVPKTGQTTTYSAADDGLLERGHPWPNPRFTDNTDGTVTDNLTGLIWLANANCANATMDWAAALAFSNTLFDGSAAHNGGDCDLADGSIVGDWRLPNVRELQSLVHYGVLDPAVPNTAGTGNCDGGTPCAFSGVVPLAYYSSSTVTQVAGNAWFVDLLIGYVSVVHKSNSHYVWPVRGGQ